MHHPTSASAKSIGSELIIYLFLITGAFLAAFAIQVFLIPNRLIDGGIVGIAMVCANIFGTQYLGYFTFALNLPFVFLAYRYIGKVFVLHMFFALLFFTGFIFFIEHYMPWAEFKGETLEVVVIGGALLGIGIGLIIRYGGCLDGTEILGIISNRLTGFTVGQVVLVINIFVFSAAGIAFKDWHPPLLSLITYMVVSKIMDTVIVGLDETKSVIIISSKSEIIANAIVHELGLGLTIMYGRGGFSGDEREILYVIAERLQLADLKELIYREDPAAFIAIENLHEVANGNQTGKYKKTSLKELFSRMLSIKK
ncbi:UPF0750 membrane protein YqfU [Neochlamydia sp. TUME1]|jgi:uncharacterized membrane-anchored protein YitT (DUF2179 family)|uniref:YitT family protein n=1 Tax=unclassified Neochlamydia TaxID=2643326 RepID=UPI00057DD2CE|nr:MULTISPECIES: YitT family protein [unclassified Neochlamydia]KIC76733.1 UPF0750 membrane protein YqfU [Neochlamydia sp. TUME1]